MVWLLPAAIAFAQSEEQVKAAFLFNFARYVEWPEEAFASGDAAFRLCMAGSPGFADVVERTVSGKQVRDRSVRVAQVASLSESGGCHILFVGPGVDASPAEVADSVAGASVLTVADHAGFARDGGVANFIQVGKRVRFEINPVAADRAGLKISSRLLRLAKVVEER